MEEAFLAGPDTTAYLELQKVLKENPEYQSLWEKYLQLRQTLQSMEEEPSPSELVAARIRKAAREHLATRDKQQKIPKLSRAWSFILSQPFVAAATVVLIIGVGIYSQIGIKEELQKESFVPPPRLEKPVKRRSPLPADSQEEASREGGLLDEFESPPPPKNLEKTDRAKLKQPGAEPILAHPKEKASPALSAPAPAPADSRNLQYQAPASRRKGYGGAPAVEGARAQEAAESKLIANPYWAGLIQQAEAKMTAKDYQGALQDLLEAQKINDSKKIRDLIEECKREIRLVEEG